MKHVRSAALSRLEAPAFVKVSGDEQRQMRKLTWCARVLFPELVAMSNFITGEVRTTFAVLTALLEFDRAPQARATEQWPTRQRLRDAVDELHLAGLLFDVDPKRNRAGKGLFFKVSPRLHLSSANDMQNRLWNRRNERKSRSRSTTSHVTVHTAEPTVEPGVQELNTNPPTPQVVLSTGSVHNPVPPEFRERLAELKRALQDHDAARKPLN